MAIGEIIRIKDIDTYRKLMKIGKGQKKKNEIKLGDRPERLMQHDGHKRISGRVRQVKWG